MTESFELPEEATARAPAHRRFALEVLGVGIFVSAYVHAAAAPALYYVATNESARLFAPQRDRASMELTLSFASRQSDPSAELVIRPQRLPETRKQEESESDEDAALSFDTLTAAPTNVGRTAASPSYAYVSERTDLPRATPEGESPSAEKLAPRPLARRKDSTAPRAAEQVADAYSTARSRTADSPSQIASEVRLGAEAESLPELVRNPPPIYPPEALKEGIEGRSVVRAKVGPTGSVLATAIVESSGSPLLDEAAEVAVRGWTFRPALRFGLTVEMEVGVPVVFSIREALAAEREADASPRTGSPR